MKIQALRSLPKEELISKKIRLMREKLELLVLKKNQELKKTHRLRIIRRQIAQLNTLLST
jgi:ribosomal protein L29